MSDVLGWFIPICIFCALLNLSMGANDESMGSAYGSKSLKILPALILGAVTEMAGSVLFGSMVSTTIQGKLFSLSDFDDETVEVLMIVLSSVVGAAFWLVLSSMLGLPTSSTHSIIGAVCFAAIAARGTGIINWGEILKIVASWFLSPLLGSLAVVLIYGSLHITLLWNREKSYERSKRWIPVIFFICTTTLGLFVALKGISLPATVPKWQPIVGVISIAAFLSIFLAFLGVPYIAKRIDSGQDSRYFPGTFTDKRTEKLFSYLEIFSASLFSFARGSNDSSHGAGPFALALAIYLDGKDALDGKPREVSTWVLALGGVCMAVGLILLGRKVVQTVGDSLTQITPTSGVMTELATAIVVLGFSSLGLPISSTHTMVGTIYGMGKFRQHVIQRWFVQPEVVDDKDDPLFNEADKSSVNIVESDSYLLGENQGKKKKVHPQNKELEGNHEERMNSGEEGLSKFRRFMKRHAIVIKIFGAWVITIPISGAVSACLYLILHSAA